MTNTDAWTTPADYCHNCGAEHKALTKLAPGFRCALPRPITLHDAMVTQASVALYDYLNTIGAEDRHELINRVVARYEH